MEFDLKLSGESGNYQRILFYELDENTDKFPVLFLAVRLKLGHNLSQVLYRFKIGTFESRNWQSFLQFTKRSRFLNIVLVGILNFPQSCMEEIENWDFGILTSTGPPSFFQFTKQLKSWDF